MGAALRAEDYRRRQTEIAGWGVVVISYRIGARWHAEVDNADVGARIARAEDDTREAAEAEAQAQAERRLSRTRVLAGGKG